MERAKRSFTIGHMMAITAIISVHLAAICFPFFALTISIGAILGAVIAAKSIQRREKRTHAVILGMILGAFASAGLVYIADIRLLNPIQAIFNELAPPPTVQTEVSESAYPLEEIPTDGELPPELPMSDLLRTRVPQD